MAVVLTGNPNAGKSTISNKLMGAHQKIGNWPGVTVDKKVSYTRYKDRAISIVDPHARNRRRKSRHRGTLRPHRYVKYLAGWDILVSSTNRYQRVLLYLTDQWGQDEMIFLARSSCITTIQLSRFDFLQCR